MLVDQFGLPLSLDPWGSDGTFHQRVGFTETIAQIHNEFANEVPAQFQPPTLSNRRPYSPTEISLAAGVANGNHFDSYASTPLSVTVIGRQFMGKIPGTNLTFNEVNPSSTHAGETCVVLLDRRGQRIELRTCRLPN